jgi:hypothetical protein
MGNQMTITLTPANSTFKHKLRYSFGSLESQVTGFSEGHDFTPAGTRSVSFTPPTVLGSEIPNALTGICTIYCYTYTSSGSHIGTTSKTVTLEVPAYNVSATIVASGNNLLNGEYVQGVSTITAIITASTVGLYGAKIKSYSSTVDGREYTSVTFTTSALSSGSKTVTTTVTDTRGKSITVSSGAVVVREYFVPQITSFTLTRQADGTTVIAAVKGKIASVNGKNGKNISVTLNDETKWYTSESYEINCALTFTGIPTDSTFTGTAGLYDYYTDSRRDAVLPTVDVTMDFHSSGKGIALGKVAEEQELLDVAWAVKSHSLPSLMGAYGAPIPHEANLNAPEYLNVGNYTCADTAIVNSLTACPTKNAFRMTVSSLLHKKRVPDSNDWNYIVREITDLYGYKYFQLVWCNTTSGWQYERWASVLDDTHVQDYVVEHGTAGIWTYRKWSSGVAECWGVHTQENVDVTSPWGPLFESAGYAVDLPEGLFVGTPQFSITPTGSGSSSGVLLETFSHGSATKSPSICIIRPASATVGIVQTSIMAKGRWK